MDIFGIPDLDPHENLCRYETLWTCTVYSTVVLSHSQMFDFFVDFVMWKSAIYFMLYIRSLQLGSSFINLSGTHLQTIGMRTYSNCSRYYFKRKNVQTSINNYVLFKHSRTGRSRMKWRKKEKSCTHQKAFFLLLKHHWNKSRDLTQVDDDFLGVGFSGLRGLELFPIASAVWGHCQVRSFKQF